MPRVIALSTKRARMPDRPVAKHISHSLSVVVADVGAMSRARSRRSLRSNRSLRSRHDKDEVSADESGTDTDDKSSIPDATSDQENTAAHNAALRIRALTRRRVRRCKRRKRNEARAVRRAAKATLDAANGPRDAMASSDVTQTFQSFSSK
jgi:hypothetical protein